MDRVKQVTRVLRSEIEPPPAAIRGFAANYLEGVVKLDKGQRIVMALNAAQVCEIGVTNRLCRWRGFGGGAGSGESASKASADAAVQKLVHLSHC